MVDLHVFGINGKIIDYRRLLHHHLGYKTKITALRDAHKTKNDVIPEVPNEIALLLLDDLEFDFGAEVALVYEPDPISKTL